MISQIQNDSYFAIRENHYNFPVLKKRNYKIKQENKLIELVNKNKTRSRFELDLLYCDEIYNDEFYYVLGQVLKIYYKETKTYSQLKINTKCNNLYWDSFILIKGLKKGELQQIKDIIEYLIYIMDHKFIRDTKEIREMNKNE